MIERALADAYLSGVIVAQRDLPCDYRADPVSAEIINNMIATEDFTHDCVLRAIDEFKRGFQSHQRGQLC